jgi:hypothetical protein
MTLTPQQEQDLAPVVYEWNMLVAAAERVRSAVDSGDQLLTNLLLEAFVVHRQGDLQLGRERAVAMTVRLAIFLLQLDNVQIPHPGN